jgi:hypothetical protein
VSFGDDSENQCPVFGHGEGELRLSVPCDCAGHYSFDLAVEGATTLPAGPIPEATLFDVVWTDVYNFGPCVDNPVSDSGAYQVSVQVSGPMGELPAVFVDAASMAPGTSQLHTVDIMDLVPMILPPGTYDVTIALDGAGVVYECLSNGDVDTTNQVTTFSFEIGAP